MAAIAAILDFGPSPKSNGMILGPYLTPHQVSSKSVEEFFCNTVHKQTNKQTNKQTDRGENSNLRPSSMAEVNLTTDEPEVKKIKLDIEEHHPPFASMFHTRKRQMF